MTDMTMLEWIDRELRENKSSLERAHEHIDRMEKRAIYLLRLQSHLMKHGEERQ